MVLGGILFLIHFVVSWKVIFLAASTPYDAQWELIWVYFWIPDFPVSLIHYGALVFVPNFNVPFLPRLIGNFDNFLVPAFVYGIVAPLWYFSVPVFISHWYNTQKLKRQRAKSD